MSIEKPNQERINELLSSLSTYFDRYLSEVESRRQSCLEQLEIIMDQADDAYFESVRQAWSAEVIDDPSRTGLQVPNPAEIVQVVYDFLKTDGVLDARRRAVHQRLADVTGHLKRVLAEIVRRSQMIVSLRELSTRALRASDHRFANGQIDSFFANFWQSAHLSLDNEDGTPVSQVAPTRTFSNSVRSTNRLSGATIRKRTSTRISERPALLEQMEELNRFVDSVVLRGQDDAHAAEIELHDWNEVRLFFKAIRYVRLDRSHLRRRLKYKVEFVDHPKDKSILIAVRENNGRLQVPQLVFSRGT